MDEYTVKLNTLEIGFLRGILHDRKGEPVADGIIAKIDDVADQFYQ